jgi:hypothetical protein
MQPSSPSDNAWDAAAWLGLQRSSADPSAWVDAAGAAASGAPWCPGEPNNKNGDEACAALLTVCSGATALVNDFPCSRALRVLCAFDAPSECPESWALQPTQGGPSSSRCTQQVSAGKLQAPLRSCE